MDERRSAVLDSDFLGNARDSQGGKRVSYRVYEKPGAEGHRMFGFGFLDVLAFLIPATSFIELEIVGRLFAPDALLASIIPLLVFSRQGRALAHRLARTFLLLAGLWLFGQVVTDLVQQTPFGDWSRGWAKIAFTMVNFAALSMLLERQLRRIVMYSVGLAVGGMLTYFLNPSTYAASQPWKFGYGVSVTWLLVLVAMAVAGQGRKRWSLAIGVVLAVSTLNIYMGFRNMGGVLFLVAAYMAAQALVSRRSANPGRVRLRHVVLVIAVLGGAAWGVLGLYGLAAESGLLGRDAQQLYERQAAGEYGLLLGGRSEMLVSLPAIFDSPMLGHGSWAKDCNYTSLLIEIRRELGYYPGQENEHCLIPAHSHLLGSWVEAGVLGAFFWLWALSLTARALLGSFPLRGGHTPLVVFVGLLLAWDILFSPFGAERRFITPFYIVIMMACLSGFRTEGLQQRIGDFIHGRSGI